MSAQILSFAENAAVFHKIAAAYVRKLTDYGPMAAELYLGHEVEQLHWDHILPSLQRQLDRECRKAGLTFQTQWNSSCRPA